MGQGGRWNQTCTLDMPVPFPSNGLSGDQHCYRWEAGHKFRAVSISNDQLLTSNSTDETHVWMMTSRVALWTIWDSRSKYCSPLASKLNFSRGKKASLHTPHFYTSKEEQVSTRTSWKYTVRNLPVQVIFLGLFSCPWQKLFHITIFISLKHLFGGVGEALNIRSTFYG